jgi:hypothetical protein
MLPFLTAKLNLRRTQGEIIERSLFDLDSNFIMESKQSNPNDWGMSQPHNCYWESGLPTAFPILENRLDSGAITKDSIFHQSWSVSLDMLTDPRNMITCDAVQQKFGSNWKPTYAPLNKFEQDCKAHWKSKLVQILFSILY